MSPQLVVVIQNIHCKKLRIVVILVYHLYIKKNAILIIIVYVVVTNFLGDFRT